MYKMNSDCSQKVISFAKYKSSEDREWSVLQSAFYSDSCYGEFSYHNIGGTTTFEIYDVSHDKEVVFSRNLMNGDDINSYTEMAKKYENTKSRIFTNIE